MSNTVFIKFISAILSKTIIDCQLNIILENCLKTQPFGLDEQMYLAWETKKRKKFFFSHRHICVFAPSDLQLQLWKWGDGNVYLFYLYLKLKGKHCRKPHCCNGVVDHLDFFQSSQMERKITYLAYCYSSSFLSIWREQMNVCFEFQWT